MGTEVELKLTTWRGVDRALKGLQSTLGDLNDLQVHRRTAQDFASANAASRKAFCDRLPDRSRGGAHGRPAARRDGGGQAPEEGGMNAIEKLSGADLAYVPMTDLAIAN